MGWNIRLTPELRAQVEILVRQYLDESARPIIEEKLERIVEECIEKCFERRREEGAKTRTVSLDEVTPLVERDVRRRLDSNDEV